MNQLFFLLEAAVNTKVDPSGAGEAVKAAGDAAAAVAPTAPSGVFGTAMANPMFMIIMYCVVIFGAMYFFSIKPQKKREKAFEEMRSKVKAGDSVLLNNGMYGRIADVTAECFIVEFGTNKGVRIPVLKQEIAGVREPNLSNKAEELPPAPEKKSLFGFGKAKKSDDDKKL